jgi:hypothetical protein
MRSNNSSHANSVGTSGTDWDVVVMIIYFRFHGSLYRILGLCRVDSKTAKHGHAGNQHGTLTSQLMKHHPGLCTFSFRHHWHASCLQNACFPTWKTWRISNKTLQLLRLLHWLLGGRATRHRSLQHRKFHAPAAPSCKKIDNSPHTPKLDGSMKN